jgi:hypothetical protein
LMRWLLDSNVLIDALAGLPHGVRVLQEAPKRPEVSVIYSTITRIEVPGFPNLSEQAVAPMADWALMFIPLNRRMQRTQRGSCILTSLRLLRPPVSIPNPIRNDAGRGRGQVGECERRSRRIL